MCVFFLFCFVFSTTLSAGFFFNPRLFRKSINRVYWVFWRGLVCFCFRKLSIFHHPHSATLSKAADIMDQMKRDGEEALALQAGLLEAEQNKVGLSFLPELPLRFSKKTEFPINPRKLSIFPRYFSNRSEALVGCYCEGYLGRLPYGPKKG